MLRDIQSVARSARRAWRRARAGRAALGALGVALIGATVTALVLEVFGGGLEFAHWPVLASWLLAIPIGAAVAAVRPIPASLAATELDRRAGFADRLGTALEFAGDASTMAVLQRADAAGFASGAAPSAAFGVGFGGRRFGVLAALLGLFLLVGGASLTWRLGPAPPEPTPEPTAAEDLLALIQADRERMEEIGDKEAVRLLTDLERTIRQIQAREEELRERVANRTRLEKPDEDFVEPEIELPEIAEATDGIADNTLITAEDLARLEEETHEQLKLTDAETDELVAQLFDHSRTAQALLDEFQYSQKDEIDAAHEARNADFGSPGEGTDMRDAAGGRDPVQDAFGEYGAESIDDPSQDIQDVIRRDLSAEGMAEHDLGHDKAESFNQFLQDFVKDVREIVSDAAMGKSPDKKRKKDQGREVQVDTGEGVADKTDAMADSGFEEMGDSKRGGSGEAPTEMAGDGEGPPPANGETRKGPVAENAMAMKGPEGAGTEAGASGAGTGNPNATGGLAALLNKVVAPPESATGPLEQALTQIAQGRLPPEQREAMFDRIARHKIQAGPASEADDVVVDYFAEAEELMVSNRDSLPPLFRDYAQSYFQAIKPGAESD